MKKHILTFLTFSNIAFSQDNQDELKIIKLVTKAKSELIYTKESFDLSTIKSKFLTDTLYDWFTPYESNVLTLSKQEMTFLDDEIEKNKNFVWPDNLLKESVTVSPDKIQLYLIDKNAPQNREIDSISKSKDSLDAVYKLKNKSYYAHSFSKPIFFRKGTLCIIGYTFYVQNHRDCKYVAIFRKRKGKWKELSIIYNNLPR